MASICMIRAPINTIKYIHLYWALAFSEKEQLCSMPVGNLSLRIGWTGVGMILVTSLVYKLTMLDPCQGSYLKKDGLGSVLSE